MEPFAIATPRLELGPKDNLRFLQRLEKTTVEGPTAALASARRLPRARHDQKRAGDNTVEHHFAAFRDG